LIHTSQQKTKKSAQAQALYVKNNSLRKQINEYEPDAKVYNPRAIVLVCDATFYGKRKERKACPWGTSWVR